ncbi:MAG: accB [Bacteroidetes bacterium]|nr:accB [Bacteroidota bacterium]
MDLSYVKKLIKLLSDSDVDEIEIEEEGRSIRLSKHANSSYGAPAVQIPVQPAMMQAPIAAAPQAQAMLASAEPSPQAGTQKKLHEIKSPIVGTFYKSPGPDAAPFVDVGSVIQPGTVLCIVEAMKLMNEIESDVSGKIAKIAVENGRAVEYGQTLFLVEPL